MDYPRIVPRKYLWIIQGLSKDRWLSKTHSRLSKRRVIIHNHLWWYDLVLWGLSLDYHPTDDFTIRVNCHLPCLRQPKAVALIAGTGCNDGKTSNRSFFQLRPKFAHCRRPTSWAVICDTQAIPNMTILYHPMQSRINDYDHYDPKLLSSVAAEFSPVPLCQDLYRYVWHKGQMR